MAKARARIPVYVEGADGRPLAGAQVHIRTDPGGVDATIYSTRTGGGTLPNPQTTDARGRVAGYLERDDYVATVTATAMDPDVEAFEAVPGHDGSVDLAWASGDLATQTELDAVQGAVDAVEERVDDLETVQAWQSLALPTGNSGTGAVAGDWHETSATGPAGALNYYKDPHGIVRVSGKALFSGAGAGVAQIAGEVMGTFPAGARPGVKSYFPLFWAKGPDSASSLAGIVSLDTSGVLRAETTIGKSSAGVTFGAIQYRAEA